MPNYRVEATTRATDGATIVAYACELQAADVASAEIAADQWAQQQPANAGNLRIIVSTMIVSHRLFHEAKWKRWYCDGAGRKAPELP
jgi:hypothetical protein